MNRSQGCGPYMRICMKLLIVEGNDIAIYKIANDHEKDEKYK